MEKIWPLVAVGCSLGVADGDGVCQWGRGGGVAPEYESELLRSTNESELQLYSSEYESEFRTWDSNL